MTERTVAGHIISGNDERCTSCQRHINDIMSESHGALVGDDGVACRGLLNGTEIDQIAVERLRREKIWDAVTGVSAK